MERGGKSQRRQDHGTKNWRKANAGEMEDAPFSKHRRTLGWLCQCASLTSLRDAKVSGKILFLGISGRVFLGKSSI